MATTSKPRIALGALLVLGIPLASLVLGSLVASGTTAYDQLHALLGFLGFLGWLELILLGPAGIILLVRAAGLRGAHAVIAGMALVPVFLVLWFIGFATLSGGLGNPF